MQALQLITMFSALSAAFIGLIVLEVRLLDNTTK